MLLTITYEGKNTQDLGYLLHKNPSRAQKFELSYGKAYVFYTEVGDERTTAALLLDINPIDLARGKVGSSEGGLFDYVNDRPYASTSFMSTAISRVFGTAMSGKCNSRQDLADTPLRLTANIYAVKDGGADELSKELFEPLGYQVSLSRAEPDTSRGDFGRVQYADITLSGTVRLCELLNHLYVLLPVFEQKHYYMSTDEIQKLLDHGEGWLNNHPQREKIVTRYFAAKRSYARKALDILLENEHVVESESDPEQSDEGEKEEFVPLNTQRLQAVKDAVLSCGAERVIDMGCGECRLTSLLLYEKQIKHITACDVSVHVLEKAAQRMHLDRLSAHLKNKLELIQASLTYRDARFNGFDCACVVEVIEHIEPLRIPAFERVVFEFAAPKTVILTTPNREYNANYVRLTEGAMRHGDHRFEWTREEFKAWADRVCEKFGYSCVISEIGEVDAVYGSPTQMVVFTKNG